MKQFTVAILSVYYIAIACGVTVNFHFCMNRLASVKLFASEVKKCGRCGMEIHESNGCCRDEVEIVKLQDDQQKTPVAIHEFTSPEQPVFVPSEFIVADFFNANEQRHFHNHSPPLLSAQYTYLQIKVFRI